MMIRSNTETDRLRDRLGDLIADAMDAGWDAREFLRHLREVWPDVSASRAEGDKRVLAEAEKA